MTDYVIMPRTDYKAICDSIRSKTDKTDTLKSGEISDQINALEPTGSRQNGVVEGKQAEYDRFWDAFQENGNRTNYSQGLCGKCWTDETFNPKYPIIPDRYSGYRIFEYTGITDFTREGIVLDFSNVQDMRWAFSNTQNREIKLPTIDLSNATLTLDTFRGYWGTDLSLIVSEKTPLDSFAPDTPYLTNLEISGTIGKAVNLTQCPLLSNESVQNIIDCLADVTGQTALKVQFHTDVLLRITDEQFAAIAAKNWTT